MSANKVSHKIIFNLHNMILPKPQVGTLFFLMAIIGGEFQNFMVSKLRCLSTQPLYIYSRFLLIAIYCLKELLR